MNGDDIEKLQAVLNSTSAEDPQTWFIDWPAAQKIGLARHEFDALPDVDGMPGYKTVAVPVTKG